MSWQYSDAPSHIAPEVGANLLTGAGPWPGVVLDPGAVYALSVEVLAPGETTVGWGVTVTDGSGGEYVLADQADAETVPGGQWVTVTRTLPAPAFPTTAAVTLTVPAGTQARNPFMGARTGRTVLTVPGDVLAETIMASGGMISGDPNGAHLELKGTGLHAYDSTGTQTAHIDGNEGVFVGGEFRTSDTLPGQVTLSDTAAGGGPGIEIAPVNAAGYTIFPHIGPANGGVSVSGGTSALGNSSSVYANPSNAGVLSTSADGGQTGVSASPVRVQMRRVQPGGSSGEIAVYPGITVMEYQHNGVTRSLALDTLGTWVKVGATSYNLEEVGAKIAALEARIAALEA